MITSLINKLLRESTFHTIKYLYPKFYRVDDISFDSQEIVKRLNIDKQIAIVTNQLIRKISD